MATITELANVCDDFLVAEAFDVDCNFSDIVEEDY